MKAHYMTSRSIRNRLKKLFPQLVFHTPNVRKFVYVEGLSRKSIVERLLNSKNDSHSDVSDDDEDNDGLRGYERTIKLKNL